MRVGKKTEAVRRGAQPRLARNPDSSKAEFNVMLDPRVADKLRDHGGGNLSAGIQLAADEALKTVQDDKEWLLAIRRPKPTAVKHTVRRARAVGRPTFGKKPRRRANVMLYPELREELRMLGEGNLSSGIERAAVLAQVVTKL
jgi:hypothetical protein